MHVEKAERVDELSDSDLERRAEARDEQHISSAAERALVRKLDCYIMPIVWIMYFLNYIDSNAIASARLDGLEDDLNLTGSQYHTCISLLFVGYLVMQIPSNMFLTKTRPSIYLPLCMMGWAIASGSVALAKNYTHLLIVRFFIGFAEAPYYPGALYLLSIFYKCNEIALRLACLYSGDIAATAFSGLIAAGIFNGLGGKHGLHGWQWLFIIEGGLTFFFALIAIFMLPDKPLETRWLSPEQRQLAHHRILLDAVQHDPADSSMRYRFKVAATDPRMWLFALMQNLHLSACSFNDFFPTVVGTLGFSRTITLALTCPPFIVAGFVGLHVGYSLGHFNERTYHITAGMSIAVLGFIVSCLTLNTAVQYICCFLFASGAYAVNGVILGWASVVLSQSLEKKVISLSIINVLANASYVYTPYLWPKSDGLRYLVASAANAAFAVGCIMCLGYEAAFEEGEQEIETGRGERGCELSPVLSRLRPGGCATERCREGMELGNHKSLDEVARWKHHIS